MALIVKKFGGSSVASPEKIYNVVNRVLRDKQPEDRVVVVVSAMGDTTDDLVSLARAVTSRPVGGYGIYGKRATGRFHDGRSSRYLEQ